MMSNMKCVPEKLYLKRETLKQLDFTAPLDTIIASNSSSYSIGELIEGLELQHSGRFISAHSCKSSPESAR